MPQAAHSWDAIYAADRPQRCWPNEDVVRFCARRLQPDMRVLEVGCGNGANTWFLSTQRYCVTAVDPSPLALAQARTLCAVRDPDGAAQRILLSGAIGQLSGASAAGVIESWYDAVIDCRVSQHVAWTQHVPAYRDYARLLRPGGWLFLLHLDAATYPDACQEDRRVSSEPWTWANITAGVYPDNGLVCMPPRETLTKMLTDDCGFIVAREEQLQRLARETITSHVAIDARKPFGIY